MHPVPRGRQRPEVGDVRAVHAEDQVETGEILTQDLACSLSGNVDAVTHRDRDRAWIGRRADLPAAGGGRIEQHMAALASLGPDGAKDALGQRRAADVAEADEQNGIYRLYAHAICAVCAFGTPKPQGTSGRLALW
ncbi:hypothetical protein BAE42_13455 [Mesorhizobium loti]|nr:hypothetical protein BAE42_13455 [Mesorhizobium loti]